MRTHSDIITSLGGIRKVARALGHTGHTKVQGWVSRDRIPVDHWRGIIELGAAQETPVTLDELAAAATAPTGAAA